MFITQVNDIKQNSKLKVEAVQHRNAIGQQRGLVDEPSGGK